MSKPKETQIIKFNSEKIILQAEMTLQELTVLLCALKAYNNGYGNSLLRRIEKQNNKQL